MLALATHAPRTLTLTLTLTLTVTVTVTLALALTRHEPHFSILREYVGPTAGGPQGTQGLKEKVATE